MLKPPKSAYNLRENEKRLIREALEASNGDKEKAAALLGISLRQLFVRTPIRRSGHASIEEEKKAVKEALIMARGSRKNASSLLGISEHNVYDKLKKWPELDIIFRG